MWQECSTGYLAPCERPPCGGRSHPIFPCGKAFGRLFGRKIVCTYTRRAEIISPEIDSRWKAPPSSRRAGRPVTAGRRRQVRIGGPANSAGELRVVGTPRIPMACIVHHGRGEIHHEHGRRQSETGAESPHLQTNRCPQEKMERPSAGPKRSATTEESTACDPDPTRLRQTGSNSVPLRYAARGWRGSAIEPRT